MLCQLHGKKLEVEKLYSTSVLQNIISLTSKCCQSKNIVFNIQRKCCHWSQMFFFFRLSVSQYWSNYRNIPPGGKSVQTRAVTSLMKGPVIISS